MLEAFAVTYVVNMIIYFYRMVYVVCTNSKNYYRTERRPPVFGMTWVYVSAYQTVKNIIKPYNIYNYNNLNSTIILQLIIFVFVKIGKAFYM